MGATSRCPTDPGETLRCYVSSIQERNKKKYINCAWGDGETRFVL